jgi:hypothetical protein
VKWRNEAGEPASPLLTIEQATAMGFTPRSNEEIKSIEATSQMAGTMGAMMGWGISEEGSLFPPDDAGALERLRGGAEAKWKTVIEDPDSADLIQYNKTKQATLSALARMVGQVGVLTDRDIGLVSQLWPTAGFTPESVARRQFTAMAKLLKGRGLTDEDLLQSGFPNWVVSGEAPPKQQAKKPWEKY